MNSRKFYLIFTISISLFLFIAGAFILNFLNNPVDEESFVSSILGPVKGFREPVNILLMGGDRVAKNTDTIMLLNFNPSTAKLNLLSVPRDTKVRIKGLGVEKINAAFPHGGPTLAINTVSSLLNVRIKYFVFIDTSSFRKIIDLFGGVDYYVPVDMDYDDPAQNLHIHLKKGQQHLNGEKAEEFIRFRHPTQSTKEVLKFYDGSDLKRIDAQQNFIKEVIKQKTGVYYLTKLSSLLRIIFKNVETNMKLNEVLKMSHNINKLNVREFQTFKLPGADSNEPGGWYFIMDKAKTDEIVKQYFTSKEGVSGGNTSVNMPAAGKNSPDTNTKNKTTKDNPSNSESSIKGTAGQEP